MFKIITAPVSYSQILSFAEVGYWAINATEGKDKSHAGHKHSEPDLLLCRLLLHVSETLFSTGQCSLDHRKNSAQLINTSLSVL